MCIWTNTGDIYSTECGGSFPVDGYRGEYCRSCSTLITERRQGMTPGPWRVDEDGDILRGRDDDFALIAMFDECDNPEANARAIAKLPEIIEAGRNLLDAFKTNNFLGGGSYSVKQLREILDEAEGVQ